jgi:hypothetical protein
VRGYVLNSSRPLFRDNLPLRQAVNFAVDRGALPRAGGRSSREPAHRPVPPPKGAR